MALKDGLYFMQVKDDLFAACRGLSDTGDPD
jgi:hypothetical protein